MDLRVPEWSQSFLVSIPAHGQLRWTARFTNIRGGVIDAFLPVAVFLFGRTLLVLGGAPLTLELVVHVCTFALALVMLFGFLALIAGALWGHQPAFGLAIVVPLWLLSSRLLRDLIRALPAEVWLLGAATFALAVSILVFRTYLPALRFFALTFFGITVLLSAVSAPWQPVVENRSKPNELAPTANAQHDVIVILLDGYSRSDVLAARLSFDNRPFESALGQLGFSIIPAARANYSYTFLAISAAMEQEYLATEDQPLTVLDRASVPDIVGGNNRVVRTMQNAGFEYVHVANSWSESLCAANVDRCLRPFKERTVDTALLQGHEFIGLLGLARPHPFPASAAASLESLKELDLPGPNKTFAFVHVTAPHAPYMLDPECNLLSLAQQVTYTEQTICVNNLILDAVEELPEEAIVLVVSDHGGDFSFNHGLSPTEWSEQEIFQRMSIFAALRMPEDCPTPSTDASLMNLINYTTSCGMGVAPAEIEDRSFIVSLEYPVSDDTIREIQSSQLAD